MNRCLICKKEIIDKKHSNRIYCSPKCQHQAQKKSIKIKCTTCNKTIIRPPSWIKTNNFCSNKCYGIFKTGKSSWLKGKIGYINRGSFKKGHSFFEGGKKGWFTKERIAGIKNINWQKGIRKYRGYIAILKPKHPFANKAGYVRRSHLVMEKVIGRFVVPPEVVHHKGSKYPINDIRNRSDDRPKNLHLFPNNPTHIKFHHSLKQNQKPDK